MSNTFRHVKDGAPNRGGPGQNIFGTPPKIVRSIGDLKSVVADGKTFYRQDRIYIPGIGNVKCAPMDNHFIYRDTRRIGWTLFCTCTSPAAVFNYDAYKHDASYSGTMLLCMMHCGAVTGIPGQHADGST